MKTLILPSKMDAIEIQQTKDGEYRVAIGNAAFSYSDGKLYRKITPSKLLTQLVKKAKEMEKKEGKDKANERFVEQQNKNLINDYYNVYVGHNVPLESFNELLGKIIDQTKPIYSED